MSHPFSNHLKGKDILSHLLCQKIKVYLLTWYYYKGKDQEKEETPLECVKGSEIQFEDVKDINNIFKKTQIVLFTYYN